MIFTDRLSDSFPKSDIGTKYAKLIPESMVRLFKVFIPTSVLALLLSEAVLILACYVLASFLTIEVDAEVFLVYDTGLLRIAFVVVCVMIGLYLHDLYTNFQIRSRILLFQQVSLVVGIALLTQALMAYVNPGFMIPRWLMVMGSGLVLVFLPLWRLLYGSVVLKALGAQRVLFLGTSPLVRELAAHFVEHPELGLATIGYVDDGLEGVALPGGPVLEKLGNLKAIVTATKPDRIVVGMAERRQMLPVHDLLELRFSGIPIEEIASAYEAAFGRVCTRELRPSQLIFSAELGPKAHSVMLQSIYSFIIGVVMFVVTSPIMLLVALAVRLSSPGAVLFRQTRVGLRDEPFTLYKFRSMNIDAESKTGAVWATKDDPRITPLGRWLRRLRLDELPQLWNVVRGDMVIVGPRPERPEFVHTLSEKIPYYRQRHCVKPGITGWAQINHRYSDTIEDTIVKLEFDLFYIKNLAPALDAYIIFHTLKVMLLSRGAQ